MKQLLWLAVPAFLILSVAVYLNTGESIKIENLRQSTPDLNIATLSDGKTRYQLEGPSQGEIILLIHGGREPAWTWDEVAPYLHTQGFQTLRYDMFGRGYSDRPHNGAYDQAFFQRQAEELLDALNISSPIHMAGYSFGGAIAVRVANARAPQIKSLTLIAPRYYAYPVPGIIHVPILRDVLIKSVVRPNALKEVRNFFYTPYLDEKYTHQVGLPNKVIGNHHAFKQFVLSDALSETGHLYKELEKHPIPTLIIHGENDVSITTDHITAIKAHLPHADQISISNADHGLIWQKGPKIARNMVRLIKDEK